MAKHAKNSRNIAPERIPPDRYMSPATFEDQDSAILSEQPEEEEALYGPDTYMGDYFPLTDTGRLQTEPVLEPPPLSDTELSEWVKEERLLAAEGHLKALATAEREAEDKEGYE